ncbi:MAG: thioredoxin family protein [Candidatus Sifarchaeia archaeon]|jgi:thioredoxin 1
MQKQTTKFLTMNNKIDNIFESKSDFELLLKKNEEPVVVIIDAKWCGCCQIMVPVIEKLAAQFKDSISFISVNSEDLEKLDLNFDSDVLPKILLFSNGRMIDQVFGTASFEFLEEKMKALLEVSSKNNMYNLK